MDNVETWDGHHNSYTWESDYEKTWEALKEDADGYLQRSIDHILERSKADSFKKSGGSGARRLSMMRHLVIVLDFSERMTCASFADNDSDYKPNRAVFCLRRLRQFAQCYFDLNPLGQLSIIYTRDKRADVLTDLSGNPGLHIRALDNLTARVLSSTTIGTITQAMEDETVRENSESQTDGDNIGPQPAGEPSLQNALKLALSALSHMSHHSSREVLVIFASLSTCDPGDINETIRSLQEARITCSFVSLTAEVYIFKRLCTETGGSFHVAADSAHFERLLLSGYGGDIQGDSVETPSTSGRTFLHPPPSSSLTEAALIRVGFPRYEDNHGSNPANRGSVFSACACHLRDELTTDPIFSRPGYICPICKSKYCELPVECKVCGLTLVSAPHLARSYSHLFPPKDFEEIVSRPETQEIDAQICFACSFTIPTSTTTYGCTNCHNHFCLDCTLFIHGTLHSCPGCCQSINKY